MTIDLKVYDNGDHTCLVWLPANAQAIPNCRGFTIHRTRKPAAGGPIKDEYLHGFVGFSDDDKLDPNAPWKHPCSATCGGTTWSTLTTCCNIRSSLSSDPTRTI